MLTLKANYLADVCMEQVCILTAAQLGRPVTFPLSNHIHIHDLGISIEGRRRLPEYKRAVSEWLEKNPQDIVISLGGNEMLILPFLKDGSKKIGELHFSYNDLFAWYGDHFNSRIRRYFRKQEVLWSAAHLDAFVVLTQAEKNNLRSKSKNLRQIYNPLSIHPSEKSDLTSQRFIAVGRLSKEKKYPDMILAWKDVIRRFPNWSLHIFGEGPCRKSLQDIIESEGLTHHVFLRGQTTEVAQEMNDSSAILLSSDTEAFPMVLLEAAACGLPIVTYDCSPGIREIVEDRGNGFIVPAGDRGELARKSMELIQDAELRRQMGSRSYEISKRFGIDVIMQQWSSLFTELIDGR